MRQVWILITKETVLAFGSLEQAVKSLSEEYVLRKVHKPYSGDLNVFYVYAKLENGGVERVGELLQRGILE